jgi:hypothetical protein
MSKRRNTPLNVVIAHEYGLEMKSKSWNYTEVDSVKCLCFEQRLEEKVAIIWFLTPKKGARKYQILYKTVQRLYL